MQCHSPAHVDEKPRDLGKGKGVTHHDFQHGVIGCISCKIACVPALSSHVCLQCLANSTPQCSSDV